jgi:hypothetical protein
MPVPEAAVDEDGGFVFGQDDVGTDPGDVERGAWSVERSAWSVARGAWSVECGVGSEQRKCGVRNGAPAFSPKKD